MEENIFDKVEIYFLIVGHTHASIDQYFSILSNQINRSDFIGSPLALEHLFSTIDNDVNPSGSSWKRSQGNRKQKSLPLGVHKLTVIFDIKTALLNLTNPSIKYYSIPHCFLFQKFGGVAIMQYSIFSSGEWLPKFPEDTTGFVMSHQLSIQLQHFDLIGGEDKLLHECGASSSGPPRSVLSSQHRKAVDVLAALCDLGDTLKALEIEVCQSAELKTKAYYDELLDKSWESKQLLNDHKELLHGELVHHMLKQNTAERGYICWLKPDVSRILDPEPLNLMPALKYLILNEEYESTGYDVFDIFGADLDVQYHKIMTALTSGSNIVLPSFMKMRSLYWTNGEADMSLTAADAAFLKSTNEITSTAQMVLQDVIEKRIKTSGNNGMYYSC